LLRFAWPRVSSVCAIGAASPCSPTSSQPTRSSAPPIIGGKTVAGNIVAACRACNNIRNAPETNRRRASERSLVASAGDDAPRSPFERLKRDLHG